MDANLLIDKFDRKHTYLRLSLTDACNFRCQYCVAAFGDAHRPSPSQMNADEIEGIVKIFIELGIRRIRFTGGEPLVRKDATDIFYRVGHLPLELAITTNGYLLHQYLNCFEEIGLRSINVSLDTLDRNKFKKITRVDAFDRVKSNIDALLQRKFHVKLNMVVMKGINDAEISDFVEWTRHLSFHIRFIEFMPFKGNEWERDKVYSYQQMMEQITARFDIIKLQDQPHDTDKKYQVRDYAGTFGIISSVTEPFCSGCNRLRITSDGKMKNCLFSQTETDLLSIYRKGEDIRPFILQTVQAKFARFGGQELSSQMNNRSMISIGG